MSDSLFIYQPGAFWLQQTCGCKNSRVLKDIHFERVSTEGDKVTLRAVAEPPSCSVCGTPYKLMVDASKCTVLKNMDTGEWN